MDGLEAVEIKLSEVLYNNDFKRLDSEFFKKIYLETEKKLHQLNTDNLIDIIDFITDGKHGGVDFKDDGVLFLRNTNIKSDFIDLNDKRFISQEESNETKRAELNEGDVLITTIGSIVGESVVIPSDFPKATINQNLVKVVPNKKSTSPYLSSFINCKYGNSQIYRMAVGNIWFLVNYPNLKKLIVPSFSEKFYKAIFDLHKSSRIILLKSESLYQQAETILLSELGLQNWQPTQANTEIKSFANSFLQSGRLDAEYYQPKFDEVIEKIKQPVRFSKPHRFYKLNDLVKIKKSIEPGSAAYMDEGIPFIRVADLSKFGLTETEIHLSPIKELENLFLKKDTILLSKDGSVGIAYKMEEDMQAVTSGAILHLTIKEQTCEVFETSQVLAINHKKVLPDYLTLVLNSTLTQLQAERDAGGSIIQHWRLKEIENVLIPVIDLEKQQQIAQLVQQSFALKKQSQQLLQTAKLAVEKAIEESEEAAMKFLNL
ncbi:restriction endonuclease subunit S [Parafilimonas terrae]|uniref:Type I restriction enzyme M protein n=1 Tax=Parafilimonas terrae TaxID=1465490 RepID=A0A1I5UE89_9BACT|nr:restriction endonuclease subunit S [Parafilimonas terrae]SFP93581.1 type I restriction enzyme M protein [Parafilimonas terrae]